MVKRDAMRAAFVRSLCGLCHDIYPSLGYTKTNSADAEGAENALDASRSLMRD